MIKQLFYIGVCLISFLCCKDKNYGWKLPHSEILKQSDEIIIKSQRKVKLESGGYTFEPDGREIYKIKGKKELSEFKNIFKETQRTGYCCCPQANYTIMFYNSGDNFVYYYVDTESKTQVRVFHLGFQYSYLIDKDSWKTFLDRIEK